MRRKRETHTIPPRNGDTEIEKEMCACTTIVDDIHVALVVGLMQVPWSWAVISLGRDH